MRTRLALVSAFACVAAGSVFVACGGDTTVGFTSPADGGNGSEPDATRMLGGDDDASPSGNDQDATTNGGDDDSGNGNPNGQDASGDDDTNDASNGRDATSPVDAGMDASEALDASDASDAADAAHDAAADAGDAGDAGDAAVDAGAFLTPKCDGTIGANEYGPNVEGEDLYTVTPGGAAWRATWNDTALYLAVTNANTAEGAVVYLVTNNLAGTLVGYNYDGSDPSMLPFEADAVIFAKADPSQATGVYEEFRDSTGENGWGNADTSKVQICLGTDGLTREMVIPWIVGGTARPASFDFLAFVAYSNAGGSGVYAQIPRNNPTDDTSAIMHDFRVANSAPGNYAFTAPQ